MNTVKTFILKLLVSSEPKGELRGSLEVVSKQRVYIFHSQEDLLQLLRQLGGPVEQSFVTSTSEEMKSA